MDWYRQWGGYCETRTAPSANFPWRLCHTVRVRHMECFRLQYSLRLQHFLRGINSSIRTMSKKIYSPILVVNPGTWRTPPSFHALTSSAQIVRPWLRVVGLHSRPSRGVGCSSSSAEVASLGAEASDAGVDLGSLVVVDPPRWYPFRQTSSVDPAGPALLQKVGVVISAKQGQIVKISKPTQDPVENVVSVAPTGWMGTPGKGASTVSGDECHGLASGGQSLAAA